MKVELASITLQGFKTWASLRDFRQGRLCVVVGGNASGKSNLLSFFSLLRRLACPPGELQWWIARDGGAHRLLHDGSKQTPSLKARLDFESASTQLHYEFQLDYSAGDTLIFAHERWGSGRADAAIPTPVAAPRTGHRESLLLPASANGTDEIAAAIQRFLAGLAVYQFHDTGFLSKMRAKASLADAHALHADACNLAAFLYRLQQGSFDERAAFGRIQDSIRQVIPVFAGFALAPDRGHIMLEWRERGCDEIFTASQASDGMLRLMALATVLCQPPAMLPPLLILDEPELGLHPQGIMLLAGLIRAAAVHTQVLLATQSVPLIDEFTLEELVVIERPLRESIVHRPSPEAYEIWLDSYATGELWRKNLMGGGPG